MLGGSTSGSTGSITLASNAFTGKTVVSLGGVEVLGATASNMASNMADAISANGCRGFMGETGNRYRKQVSVAWRRGPSRWDAYSSRQV